MKLFIFLIVCASAFGYYSNFDDNFLLSDRMKERIGPHLLPLNHPIKPMIDLIFSQSRVTESEGSILAAGFTLIAKMDKSLVFVVKHPSIPGYVFKIHLDSEKKGRSGTPSWEWLTRRCDHAATIRTIIQKNGLCHFVVPDKWLYVLPEYPKSSRKKPQPIVLIATEYNLFPRPESALFYQTEITPVHLRDLYLILKTGSGSTHLDKNVPYTREGKFVFIDTERAGSGDLEKARKFFNKRMQSYWLGIIR